MLQLRSRLNLFLYQRKKDKSLFETYNINTKEFTTIIVDITMRRQSSKTDSELFTILFPLQVRNLVNQ